MGRNSWDGASASCKRINLRRQRLLSSSLSSLARSRYVRPEYQSPGSYRYFQTRGYVSASTSFIRILRFFLVKVCREFNKSLLSLEVVGSSTGDAYPKLVLTYHPVFMHDQIGKTRAAMGRAARIF
jgi:hypothetical protein